MRIYLPRSIELNFKPLYLLYGLVLVFFLSTWATLMQRVNIYKIGKCVILILNWMPCGTVWLYIYYESVVELNWPLF